MPSCAGTCCGCLPEPRLQTAQHPRGSEEGRGPSAGPCGAPCVPHRPRSPGCRAGRRSGPAPLAGFSAEAGTPTPRPLPAPASCPPPRPAVLPTSASAPLLEEASRHLGTWRGIRVLALRPPPECTELGGGLASYLPMCPVCSDECATE